MEIAMDPGIFARLEKQMPDLLAAVREYLQEDPLRREFEVSEHRGWYELEKGCIEYFETEIPGLFNKVRILLNHKLVKAISHAHIRRYVISEDLAEYLTAWPEVTAVVKSEAVAPEPSPNLAPDNKVPTSIGSDAAVQSVLKYIREKGLNTPQFAKQAQTTDRTIRRFLKRGLARHTTFDLMAASMGLSREDLLRGKFPKEHQ